MVTSGKVKRLMHAYPMIYLACHRRHVLDDESGRRLTSQQVNLLDHLMADRPMAARELAAHMNVTEATMSVHLGRLERGGYIRRQRDLRDKRRMHVSLSAAGLRVQQQNSLFDPQLLEELICLIPAAEIESALAGLETIASAAERLMERRSKQRRRTFGE